MVKKSDIKILIVDDDRELCDLLVELFLCTGLNVRGVYSAQEALDIVHREEIGIVVTDIHMPGKDGFYLLKEIKKKRKEFPKVLFISGQSVDLETAYNMGVEGFFEKPFNIDEVKRTIMRCLLRKKDWLQYPVSKTKGRVTKKFYDWESLVQSKEVAFGTGGLFISDSHPFLEVGDACDFKIEFISGGPIKKIKGQGIIKWIRPPGQNRLDPGFGIEVVHVHRDSMDFYIRLLASLDKISVIPMAA